ETSRTHYGRLLAPEAELGPTLAAFDGRPYINLSQYARVGGFVRMSLAALLRDIGHVGELPADADQPVRIAPWLRVAALPTMWRLGVQRLRLQRLLKRTYAKLEA